MSVLKDKDGNDLVRDSVVGVAQVETRALQQQIASNGAEVLAHMHGASTAMVHITGTINATYGIDGTVDGTNFFPIEVFNQATQQAVVASALTVTGIFLANVAGLKSIRVRTSAYTSGPIFVAIRCSSGVNKVLAELLPATLAVTATGASGAAVTLTIPSAGAGLFHYITRLSISLFNTAATTGAAAPVVVTTSNLPGSRAFSLAYPTRAAAGELLDRILLGSTNPIKSTAAATPTTIICPIVTVGLWRVTADYYVGQ
jgi:hypothetical protein